MRDMTQVKADIPRELKRRTFAAFAMRDEKFAPWLRVRLEEFLEEIEAKTNGKREERLVRPTGRG